MSEPEVATPTVAVMIPTPPVVGSRATCGDREETDARAIVVGALRSIDPNRRLGMTRLAVGWGGTGLSARKLLRGDRLERVAKASSGRDTELGEGPVEVAADRPVRQEQPLRDLLVRQA
jgi:hypothetical protein